MSGRLAEISQSPFPSASFNDVQGEIARYLEETKNMLPGLFAQFPDARFAMVPVQQLITPLVLIDYEYVEELKATLTGNEPRDIADFALPRKLEIKTKAAIDPLGRYVHFISAEKTLAITPFQVAQIAGGGGYEIKAAVVGTPQLILVSHFAGRLFLRSGVHRAYLLASLGIKEIPCLLRDEDEIPLVAGIYPSFAPHILALPRPPLLMDAFDPTLTLSVPIVRTSKIIRLSAEEIILPVE